MFRLQALPVVLTLAIAGIACSGQEQAPVAYRQTLNELILEEARTCSSGFDYPQRLIDGLSVQLIEELRCMDESWLEFYEPCQQPGCIYDDGPQPLAARPEVLEALRQAALLEDDFISIRAGYRDVGMQYYSRWYKENCNSSFPAAAPGESNHQGGRAVDVTYYNFWWDTLLSVGFEHPYDNDRPHFELVGDATFRAESAELQSLSITAFQRLWNRNYPEDPILEDGVYGPATQARLGASPVDGFPIGACPPGGGDGDAGEEVDVEPDVADGIDDAAEDGHDAVLDAGDTADEDVVFEPDAPGDVADEVEGEPDLPEDAQEEPAADVPDEGSGEGFGRFDHDPERLKSRGGCASLSPRSPASMWLLLLTGAVVARRCCFAGRRQKRGHPAR